MFITKISSVELVYCENAVNLLEYFDKKRSTQRDCQMPFIIGRDYAEVHILKKWNWNGFYTFSYVT